MASKEFHRFPDLPWELRRQIWEDAVRPIGHGMHTFSIVHDNETAHENTDRPPKALPSYYSCTPKYFAIVPASEDDGKPNRLAYLWDAGLWTACKESRDVMMTLFNMAHWFAKRRELVSGSWVYIPGFVYEGGHHDLATIITIAPSIQDGGEDWHLLIRPGQDAIKLTMETLQRCGPEFEWPKFVFDLPFSNVFQGCDPITNIVLDFESKWCFDYMNLNFSDPKCAPSKFLYGLVAGLTTWLIDRGKYREDPYFKLREGEAVVLYDCDDEYVQVEHRSPSTEEWSAAYFVSEMGKFGDGIWSSWSQHDCHVRSYIGILRPRKLADALQ